MAASARFSSTSKARTRLLPATPTGNSRPSPRASIHGHQDILKGPKRTRTCDLRFPGMYQAGKEVAMKLTAAQIERTASQFEAQPIPDESRLVPELTKLFGDHTFFLGSTGLHIIDATEPTKAGAPA